MALLLVFCLLVDPAWPEKKDTSHTSLFTTEAFALRHPFFTRDKQNPGLNSRTIRSTVEAGKIDRRSFVVMSGAGFFAALGIWLTSGWLSEPVQFHELPALWKGLFAQQPGLTPLPRYGQDDYLLYAIQSLPYAYDKSGRELGFIESSSAAQRLVVHPQTGEILGYFNAQMTFEFFDRYGRKALDVTNIPYDSSARPLPGVPEKWKIPRVEFDKVSSAQAQPIYKVHSRDASGHPQRVELIGYIKFAGTNTSDGILYDVTENPIARLKPGYGILSRKGDYHYHYTGYATTESLGRRYLAGDPARQNTAELKRFIEQFHPDTREGKITKLMLTHRWVLASLMQGRYSSLRIDPLRAKDLARWLEAQPLDDINRALTDSGPNAQRARLWEALAQAHPWYHVAWEAVKTLGWEEDAPLLKYVVHEMSNSWKFQDLKNREFPTYDLLDDMIRKRLVEILRYNALTDAPAIAGFLKNTSIQISPATPLNEQIYLHSFMQAQSQHQISGFEGLVLLGTALQRAGYPVEMRFPDERYPSQTFGNSLKSISSAPCRLIFRDREDPAKWFALGPQDTSATRISDAELRLLEKEPHSRRFSFERLPTCSWDVLPYLWSDARINEALHKKYPAAQSEDIFGTHLLGLRITGESETLYAPLVDAYSSYQHWLNQIRAAAFDKFIKARNINLETSPMKIDTLYEQKAAFAQAFALLPGKFVDGLLSITLRNNIFKLPYEEAQVAKNGKVTRTFTDVPAAGSYGPMGINLAAGGLETAVHELTHHYEERFLDGTTPRFPGLTDVYDEISWILQPSGQWKERGTRVNMAHFFGETHAVDNPREDLATAAQNYVTDAAAFRAAARAGMAHGDFVLASKYVFLKYLPFLDTDGINVEYSLNNASEALTFEEVLGAMAKSHQAETRRLESLVKIYQDLWKNNRDDGEIVDQSVPYPGRPTVGKDHVILQAS